MSLDKQIFIGAKSTYLLSQPPKIFESSQLNILDAD